MADLTIEVTNRVGILTMNRPDKLNALTRDMNQAAVAALREMSEDPEVGAVVLTGRGSGLLRGRRCVSHAKGRGNRHPGFHP